ncbi:2-dehydro-3-deoxyphosphooctonate aldolase [Flavobacterium qiangtangense]|uniref:2-dehydro-3-deoxyphosphooctonate aldolase n=1 Tax=Flavobacterium qiangtangense TaxID=1442595 RepID=A0ABW1PL83_9FLAO
MKIKSLLLIVFAGILMVSCISAKSTLKNVDENAPEPTLTKEGWFLITEYAKDKKYGYDKNYPINVFYKNVKDEEINQNRFLDALTGPKGETISYKKLESCCPFPTKRGESGAGFLDIYEVTYPGLKKPIKLYFNIYEKGYLFVPKGFGLKK